MTKLKTMPVTVWAVPLLFCLLAACGDDGEGNNDTLFTGLSGVVIFFIVIWLVFRAINKRRGDRP